MKDQDIMKQYKEEYEQLVMDDVAFRKYKLKIEQAKKEKQQEKRLVRKRTGWGIAAAIAILFIAPNVSDSVANAMENIPILGSLIHVVTLRNYRYEDNNQSAEVEIPEVLVDVEKIDNPAMKENVIRSSAEINKQITTLSEMWIADFEKNMKEEGYQNLMISSEIVQSTNSYFTLKLICFLSMASGYEEHHYYTIDLNTGKELTLGDLFWEDFDYIGKISEEIKSQMKNQMEEDENVIYFIESDMPEFDFKQITDETEFYINENGKLVISFNEAEVAPAYMGCVEFIIDSEGINNMRKPCAGYVAKEMLHSEKEEAEDVSNIDDFIEGLEQGKWYAAVELSTTENPIILVADQAYDNGDGTMATIFADLYAFNEEGKIVKYGHLESTGTAYPLAASEGYLYYAGNHHISKMFVDESCSALLTKEDASEIFNEKGESTYYYFSLEDGFAGKVEDSSRLDKLFSEYTSAKVIAFTQK